MPRGKLGRRRRAQDLPGRLPVDRAHHHHLLRGSVQSGEVEEVPTVGQEARVAVGVLPRPGSSRVTGRGSPPWSDTRLRPAPASAANTMTPPGLRARPLHLRGAAQGDGRPRVAGDFDPLDLAVREEPEPARVGGPERVLRALGPRQLAGRGDVEGPHVQAPPISLRGGEREHPAVGRRAPALPGAPEAGRRRCPRGRSPRRRRRGLRAPGGPPACRPRTPRARPRRPRPRARASAPAARPALRRPRRRPLPREPPRSPAARRPCRGSARVASSAGSASGAARSPAARPSAGATSPARP